MDAMSHTKCYNGTCFSLVYWHLPPSSSVPSLEVVIVPTVLTSCWNMQEQLRGRSWQSPAISTQPDSHPAVSSEYNPFISSCPQFPLMNDWKVLSEGREHVSLGFRKEMFSCVRLFMAWLCKNVQILLHGKDNPSRQNKCCHYMFLQPWITAINVTEGSDVFLQRKSTTLAPKREV